MRTVPLLVPDAPETMVTNPALDVAVHAHPLWVTTEMPVLPPAAGMVPVDVATVYVHVGVGAASCDRVTDCPAMVTVPLRAAPVLACAVTVTVPEPVPDVRLSDAQLTPPPVVQPQSARFAVTVTVFASPMWTKLSEVGETVNAQAGGAASCGTETFCPAMVTVPVLAAPVLGATVMSTVPLPGPVPLTMVIHGVAVDGVHGHVDKLVTTEMPVLPPAAGIVPVVVGMVYVHVGGTSLYVAVIVTLLAGIVTVVFGELTLATLDVSPVHLSNI